MAGWLAVWLAVWLARQLAPAGGETRMELFASVSRATPDGVAHFVALPFVAIARLVSPEAPLERKAIEQP